MKTTVHFGRKLQKSLDSSNVEEVVRKRQMAYGQHLHGPKKQNLALKATAIWHMLVLNFLQLELVQELKVHLYMLKRKDLHIRLVCWQVTVQMPQ